MARHSGPVLVDTNAILECWRVGAWRALASGYGVETVEDCVIETQTGFQRRRREQQIDAGALRRVAGGGPSRWATPSAPASRCATGHLQPRPGRAVALGPCADPERRLDIVRSRQGEPALRRAARLS